MLLNSRVQYALIIINNLRTSEGDNPTSLQEIKDRHHLSIHFLEQVARDLRIAGLINSKKGPGGGYFIDKDKMICLLAVMKAVKALKLKPATQDFNSASHINNIFELMEKQLENIYV